MIERKFVAENMNMFEIQEYIHQNLKGVGHSHTKLQKTPLGEKITIFTSRPGLIVGRKGQNIKKLTLTLKNKFKLENPQIEIAEVTDIFLDPTIVADMIVSSLERFGTTKFKGVGHKMMENVMKSGARGVEILISGKIPSSRAKSWRFYAGYMKKCGDVAVEGVKKAIGAAQLKTGTVGVQVSIMPPDVKLPDKITMYKAGLEPELVEITGKASLDAVSSEENAESEKGKSESHSSEKQNAQEKQARKKSPAKKTSKPKKELVAEKIESQESHATAEEIDETDAGVE